VESEVGPIKYIAALVYGENPDANVLERAVRLVIIMIVLVFDPLALTLILAANKQFQWAREGTGGFIHDEPRYPPDDGTLTDSQIQQIKQTAQPPKSDPHEPGWMFDKFDYLKHGNKMFFQDLKPMPAAPDTQPDLESQPVVYVDPPTEWSESVVDIERPGDYLTPPDEYDDEYGDEIKAAIIKWKAANPDDTLKNQRYRLIRGEIDQLPWMSLVADNALVKQSRSGFGTEFPKHAERGDTFVRVDRLPSVVYKYNGRDWMEVDKNLSDSYTYDTAYIDHLIERIASGEYDPDLLSETERDQVTQRLQTTKTST
jgi:hypothetical protein